VFHPRRAVKKGGPFPRKGEESKSANVGKAIPPKNAERYQIGKPGDYHTETYLTEEAQIDPRERKKGKGIVENF